MNRIRKAGWLLAAAAVLAVVFALGFYAGVKAPAESKIVGIINPKPLIENPEQVDMGPFWEAWNYLETKYVDAGKIKRQAMVYGAISGMVKSLGDPYTVFFPPEETKAFQSEIKGQFEGVGMEIGIRRDILTVVAPLKGTPADHAGIKAGDRIIKIDDKITSDMTVEEAVRLIRGPKGTKVKLAILSNGDDQTRTVELERAVIDIPVIDTQTTGIIAQAGGSEKKEQDLGDIFVIKLYNFSETSPDRFRNALREMAEKGRTKLIIDLRNNPGGYLEAAVDMASWFLPQGDVVVQEDLGKKTDQPALHRSRGYYAFKDTPIIILVNQGSASASEILAGALRDHGRAKLVGEKTFGKGSVQEYLPLTSDTSIKITIAKWLTPNGTSISEKGLDPDVEVKPTKKDIESGRDPVMEKAIEMLKNIK